MDYLQFQVPMVLYVGEKIVVEDNSLNFVERQVWYQLN